MKYCEAYAALLDLFVDGELSLEEILGVQAHLDECPTCRAYVDDALAMRAAFPDVEETEVPEGFSAGVMAAIHADLAAHPVTPRKKKKTPWVGVLASLAACCAIVIVQQNGPMAIKAESAAASMAYDTAVAEEAAAPEAAIEFSATTADTAEAALMDRMAETSSFSLQNEDDAAEEETCESPAEAEPLASPSCWVEGENVVFACVVFLPQDRAGNVLDGCEGKPYVTEEGVVGTGYALEQSEFERILYDAFDYPHGPELDPARTTDLCCIVVTE